MYNSGTTEYRTVNSELAVLSLVSCREVACPLLGGSQCIQYSFGTQSSVSFSEGLFIGMIRKLGH